MQHHLDIDPARCVGCGCCARECPQYLLRIEEKKCVVSDEDMARCHGCGHCLAVCPAGALVLDGIREPLPDCIPLRMTAEGRAQLFQGRRSIRHYRQDPVPREVLEICLDMARYAPTGGNTQQVEWICADPPQMLRGVVVGLFRWVRGPGGFYARMADLFDQGHDSILRGAPGLVLAHAAAESRWAAHDCSIAASWLELALYSFGAGSCWAGLVISALRAGEDLGLGVPAGRRVEAALMYGYPAVRYLHLPRKEPLRLVYVS